MLTLGTTETYRLIRSAFVPVVPRVYKSFFFLFLLANSVVAQGIHGHHDAAADTNTLSHFFGKGRFYGHARSYWAVTLNQQNLTDAYAWGVGAGIGYETPKFLKRFQLGMSGFFMFNLASSDLAQADPTTGQTNRYEVGLFDIERPNDHEDLDRLEELFVKLHLGKKSLLTVGRQIPQTPFVNPQDGRMRPTLIEAATLELNEWKNLKLHGSYTWAVSPRSTVRWFEVGESIGIYPVGVDVNGKPSGYKNHVESSYIGILGGIFQKKQWNVQLWNTYVQNITNTLWTKIEYKSKPRAGKNWMAGVQLFQQNTVGEGGNADPTKVYSAAHQGTRGISGRVGQQSAKLDWYLNATRIAADGRFLMPREWGREPFYTFMPRERNEGYGDVTATSLNMYFKPEKHVKIELSGGYFQLPDVKNSALNKYGMPSYSQLNLGVTYQFDHYLKGLNALLLVVRKDPLGETYQNERFVFNKVNMTHLNFIINYHY